MCVCIHDNLFSYPKKSPFSYSTPHSRNDFSFTTSSLNLLWVDNTSARICSLKKREWATLFWHNVRRGWQANNHFPITVIIVVLTTVCYFKRFYHTFCFINSQKWAELAVICKIKLCLREKLFCWMLLHRKLLCLSSSSSFSIRC